MKENFLNRPVFKAGPIYFKLKCKTDEYYSSCMQGKTSLTKEDIAAVFSLYDRVSLIIPHKKNQLTTKIQSSIKTCCTLNIYWQFIKVDFLAFTMSLFSTLMVDYEHFLHCNTCFNWLEYKKVIINYQS